MEELDMAYFATLSSDIESRAFLGGTGVRVRFPSGYGASVVRHRGSYGHERGLFELAVLKNDHLCYSTEVTNDVIGHLTSNEVTALVKQISEL